MSNNINDNNTKTIITLPISLLDLLKNEFNAPLSTKRILSNRKTHFIQEYLKLNSVSISSTCYVKIDTCYKYGHLTLYNSKLAINQYESNKISNNIEEQTLYYNRSITPISLNEDLKSKEDIFYPLFFIDFNLVTCQLVIHKTKKKFRLVILGKNIEENDYDNDKDYIYNYRVVKFNMPEIPEKKFKLVCEAINKSIILSNGYRNNIFSINLRKNFCNEYFINYKEFNSKAYTGDILLFRGFSKESHLQRVFTNADYDHVAVLLRKNNILYVYESTGKDGVKLRPWQEFIMYLWYLLYEKMVFRPLIVDEETMKKYVIKENKKENNNILYNIDMYNSAKIKEKFDYFLNKNVNNFIEQTEDRKYSFSKTGYICSSTMKKNSITNRKGYSCSELVAACYYHSGIISDKLEASNYLPGAFSRNGKIAFIPGFELGKEYIIDFSSSSSSI